VLQVRLNEDEYAAIERIAARRELPVSTVARERLLALIAEENGEEGPLFALLAATDRLKDLASDLEQLEQVRQRPRPARFLNLRPKPLVSPRISRSEAVAAERCSRSPCCGPRATTLEIDVSAILGGFFGTHVDLGAAAEADQSVLPT
jgi:hypothetical protein